MQIHRTALAFLCLAAGGQSFMIPTATTTTTTTTTRPAVTIRPAFSQSYSRAPRHSKLFSEADGASSEVDRLKSMAAKLRAEAAALEAKQQEERANEMERAFRKFDTNKDGAISFEELKQGLEKYLKTELQEDRVMKLMEEFDASGDGSLQLDEFVGVERFRNRLDAIVRDEKQLVIEAQIAAKKAAEAASFAAAKMELINEKEPTLSEKALSILPYLFPLMDGLQFGRFLLEGQDNPAIAALAAIFILYRSIPFSGFIAFFALSILSNQLGLNRLIRFNMQQAIFLDVFLFIPGFIASVGALVLSGLGVTVPAIVSQVGNDAIFVTLVAAIGYSVISSLLGVIPDKLPGISDQVNARIPTLDMFDDQGRFIPKNPRDQDDKDKK
jgi:hypothetical protein